LSSVFTGGLLFLLLIAIIIAWAVHTHPTFLVSRVVLWVVLSVCVIFFPKGRTEPAAKSNLATGTAHRNPPPTRRPGRTDTTGPTTRTRRDRTSGNTGTIKRNDDSESENPVHTSHRALIGSGTPTEMRYCSGLPASPELRGARGFRDTTCPVSAMKRSCSWLSSLPPAAAIKSGVPRPTPRTARRPCPCPCPCTPPLPP
jgi:hypothetical protein